MPIDYKNYPPDWFTVRREILIRAGNRCECRGECGIHGGPTKAVRCCEINHTKARWARGRVVLTIAHECACDPLCAEPAHLRALCQRCHLRYDRFRHAAKRIENARAHATLTKNGPTVLDAAPCTSESSKESFLPFSPL